MVPPFELVGFHHVQLAIRRGGEEEAERFYAGVMGLALVPKTPGLEARGGAWFRGAGVEVHLGVEDPFRPARKAHPAFLVSGLDALRERLASSGVEIHDDVALAGHRRFHVSDPFGNRLELIERSAS